MKRSFATIPALFIALTAITSSSAGAGATTVSYPRLCEAELASGIYFENAPYDSVEDFSSAEYITDGDSLQIIYRDGCGSDIIARKSSMTPDMDDDDDELQTIFIKGTAVNIFSDDGRIFAQWNEGGWEYSLNADKAVGNERIQKIAEEIIR